MGAVEIVGIPSADFQKIYPSISWAFDSFATRAHCGVVALDLAGQVVNETSQCWIAWSGEVVAVALTEVQDGRTRDVIMTHCAGRNREAWQDKMVSEIRAWAKSIGAARFVTVSRPGWTAFLKGMGMRETHRIMEQSLE